MTANLPELEDVPAVYSGCCLSLSRRLLSRLSSWIPNDELILSIGCGTGLLESYMLQANKSNVEGVEVSTHSGPQHLPADRMHYVNGIRDISLRALEASIWLWVYPRHTGLFKEYLDSYGNGAVEAIVWLGPKRDWPEYAELLDTCGKDWGAPIIPEDSDELLAEYEIAVLIKRRDTG